jgi:hypothetical protein
MVIEWVVCGKPQSALTLLAPLQHENFHVDLKVDIEMKRLKKIVTWIPFNPKLIFFF